MSVETIENWLVGAVALCLICQNLLLLCIIRTLKGANK